MKQAIVEEQVKEISIWKHIIQVFCDQEYIESVPILEALSTTAPKVDKDVVIGKIATLNDSLQKELQQLSLPADIVMRAVSRQEIPEQIQELIDTIREDNDFVANSFPLELDEEAFSASQKETRVDCYRSLFKEFMAYDQYKEVLTLLPKILLSLDFYSGIHKSFENALPIKTGNHIELEQSENLFLDKAQPITYSLQETKAAILTGANSGGKTTLLEHVVQVALLKQLRFPASGTTQTPEYDAIYYFAKNSGSTNKGAFETLLTQLSGIAPLKRTLILADEMEAVTEPSVAAKLIAKTMKFFVAKDCDMIFATHLGGILQSEIKGIARIDGICAKGIENGKILIDHNPIMGKLANSTPELIIQKLAKQEPCEFYSALME
ncbi:MAG: DNA mismatch repair protein MutS2 [Candidatus Woesearchaeota archaeon]